MKRVTPARTLIQLRRAAARVSEVSASGANRAGAAYLPACLVVVVGFF